MKVLISIVSLLVCSLVSYAQNSCDLKIINDKLTQKTRVSTSVVKEGDLKIYFVGGNTRSEYHKMFFEIETDEKPCVDYLNNIYILFEDGSRIDRGNVLSYNCDGISSFIVNGKRVREDLKNKRIEAIQVNTARSNYRVEVSTENAQILLDQYNCLESRDYLLEVKYRN